MKNILAVAVLLLLLTHPAVSAEGARQGLLLWSQTVLPALLPFMICSNVIVSIGALPFLMAPFRPVLRRFFHLSEAGGYVLLSGLLCGYPMGAKTASEFLAQGKISPEEARCLWAVSNHPSPMFLLGYVASCLDPQIPLRLVMISLYLPVLPLYMLARKVYASGRDAQAPMPSAPPPAGSGPGVFLLDPVMMNSMEIMVRIGGYIMLFSILAAFIRKLPLLPPLPKALILGLAEITTGIQAVSLAASGPLQGLCITAVTAFGGLSGIFQTRSVNASASLCRSGEEKENAGLSIRHYILWKLLHTAVSCLVFILLTGILLPE